MFDHEDVVVGLWPGETPEDLAAEDDVAHLITVDELSSGWVEDSRHVLPDLESIPPGLFLAAILGSVDRSRLNGFDLVRLVKARERLVAHAQAGVAADTYEMAHSAPGDEDSDPSRLGEGFEYAADELRPVLVITRRAAKNRLGLAFDLRERLPRV